MVILHARKYNVVWSDDRKQEDIQKILFWSCSTVKELALFNTHTNDTLYNLNNPRTLSSTTAAFHFPYIIFPYTAAPSEGF